MYHLHQSHTIRKKETPHKINIGGKTCFPPLGEGGIFGQGKTNPAQQGLKKKKRSWYKIHTSKPHCLNWDGHMNF